MAAGDSPNEQGGLSTQSAPAQKDEFGKSGVSSDPCVFVLLDLVGLLRADGAPMSVLLARVVGASAAVATAAAFLYFKKRRVVDQSIEQPDQGTLQHAIPQPAGFDLVSSIAETDEFNELIRWMPAADSVRLSQCSRLIHERVTEPTTAQWCAESRRTLLEQRQRPGDLPLAESGVMWTLERLHLCEKPPRFPRIYFGFASDEIGTEGIRRLTKVANLLKRHPKLRLCVHGFAQPDAPGPIGEALAQARATAVRKALLLKLRSVKEFASEDPHEGVRDDPSASPWSTGDMLTSTTRLVGGHKLQAIGRWRQMPRNRNFEELTRAAAAVEDSDDESDDDDSSIERVEEEYESDDETSKLRRAEFTLLGLDDA